jgi:hypothetical protein
MKACRSIALCGAAGKVALLAVGIVGGWSGDALAEDRRADDAGSEEHTIIVGVGGATELELADRSLHPGANLMVEWDAVENWLEFEVGASVLAADGGVEVPIDLLFKKPFKLARWAEFMIGVGPEVVQVTGANKGTYFGGEVALDFMFWPWRRHVGVWVEPEYDLILHDGASSGIGATGGVLFGW